MEFFCFSGSVHICVVLNPLHVPGSAVVLRHCSQLRGRAPGRRVFILWMGMYVLSVASLEVAEVGVSAPTLLVLLLSSFKDFSAWLLEASS